MSERSVERWLKDGLRDRVRAARAAGHEQAGEGYSKADATYAVDHVDVNWNQQAAKAAKAYLAIQPFSRAGLIHAS